MSNVAPKRIVITGVGALTPLGVGANAYYDALVGGDCGIGNIEPIAGISVAGRHCTALPASPSRAEAMAHLALAEALEDSSIKVGTCSLGLSFGSAIGATVEIEQSFAKNDRSADHLVDFGGLSERIAESFGLRGARYTSTTGCVAGLDALGLAFDMIKSGYAAAMAVVATDATQSPIVFAAFERIGALTKSTDPATASQPFGRDRNGFVLSEASAAVILETFDNAKARGAHIYAEMMEWHSICNAYHMTNMRTDGSDLARLIDEVLKRSGLSIDDICLVDCHGTSTKINETAELSAINSVFGRNLQGRWLTAQKSAIGHSLGASNLVEIVGLCKMLERRTIPKLRTLAFVDGEISKTLGGGHFDPDIIARALKLSSSFSGIHSACVLSEVK